MSEQFVKGYTNNHLVWVMVDATDFATPESALSAATKIKIYGKVKGATGVNFVSSGTGSLTNDIQHVGASALGIYTIALAKADLSDASAAWYDKYVISLSATGAAYQTIIADGGIWISDLSAIASDIRSDVSDMHSDLIVMSDVLSNVYSACTALSDAVSNAYSAVLLTQSLASDAASAAIQGNSRVLLVQSRLSDFNSTMNSDISDIKSMLTVVLSDTSDIASRISSTPATKAEVASATYALFSDFMSNCASAFAGNSDAFSDVIVLLTTTGVQLNASSLSDLRSAIAAGPAATITASDISDIVSAVWGAKYDIHSVASSFGSLFERMASDISDLDSMVTTMSDVLSNAYSAATAIKAKTDGLTFTVANQVDANIQYVNDVAVTGTGAGGDEWGP